MTIRSTSCAFAYDTIHFDAKLQLVTLDRSLIPNSSATYLSWSTFSCIFLIRVLICLLSALVSKKTNVGSLSIHDNIIISASNFSAICIAALNALSPDFVPSYGTSMWQKDNVIVIITFNINKALVSRMSVKRPSVPKPTIPKITKPTISRRKKLLKRTSSATPHKTTTKSNMLASTKPTRKYSKKSTGTCYLEPNCKKILAKNVSKAQCQSMGGKSWRQSGGSCQSIE